jgi:hypothetical protein
MPGVRRRHRSRKDKTMRWIAAAILLCSAMSCIAPVLYASNDCSRWLAEYKQGILQRRAARRLRAARYRLTVMVRPPAPVHPHPLRHRMGPLESLRRFQIDCGELETPPPPAMANAPVIPPLPVEPRLEFVSFAEVPPDLPPPGETPVGVETPPVPPLINVPTTPIETTPLPPATGGGGVSVTPEPASLVLVLTGAGLAFAEVRRRRHLAAR